ncbi:hypothetical protein N0V90_007150 [Kalmusia sp. IMI 367209]|nr:hypothetical protein N0V90_007150 [Kalmusia sp. IMI 367209]
MLSLTIQSNTYLNQSNFVAFDPAFFDFLGPNVHTSHVWQPDYTWIHEASCFVPSLNALFFTSWGFLHDYQYLLDASTHELRNVTTSPPIVGAHGCVHYNGSLYVATDGGDGHYASIYKVNPETWEAEVVINNFYQQPFMGFNDLDIDPNGNIWVTDSTSAWTNKSNSLTTFAPPTSPAVYFINTTSLTPKLVFALDGGWTCNLNGIAVAPDNTLYVDVTSINSGRPKSTDPLRSRALYAFDALDGRPLLRNQRLFANPVSRFWDGVRVAGNGYVFAASSDGVDVIEPIGGTVLGRIRTPGGGRKGIWGGECGV